MSLKPYLHSASVIAIGSVGFHAASTQQAEAQGLDGYSLTVMGGMGNANVFNEPPFDSGGGTNDGLFGAVMLETGIAGYDARLSFSYYTEDHGFGSAASGVPFNSGGGSYDINADLDFDVSHMALDGQIFIPSGVNDNMRWIVGARAMQFQQTASLNGAYSDTSGGSESGEASVDATFRGIGPSIGFQYATGPIGGGPWGFRGEAVGSLLYGTERLRIDSSSGAPASGGTGTSSETVTNVDFSVQADYYLNDTTTLFLQYRASQMYSFDGGGSNPRADSVILGLTTEF